VTLHGATVVYPVMKKAKKVKCTLVQTLMLCTGRTAHRGSRGIALLFLDHGTRRGWRFSVTPRLLFTRRKDPVPIVQEAGCTPGPVWTGVRKISSAPGFDLRTAQPVASRYTDWATRPTYPVMTAEKLMKLKAVEPRFLHTIRRARTKRSIAL